MENFNIINYAKKREINLSEEQKSIIQNIEKNTAVVAVPGSGKTTVFVLRLFKLIKEMGIEPNEILALTFSKDAAGDMAKRFEKWAPYDVRDVAKTASDRINDKDGSGLYFTTIHSFAYSFLKEFDKDFDSKNLIEMPNDHRKTEPIKKAYQIFNNNYPNKDTIDNIISKIGYYKNLMISPDNVTDKIPEIPNFSKIYKEYELRKKVAKYYDFDDLLERAYLILKNNDEVRNIIQNRYKYIQIDEYQDTSRIQNAIIKEIHSLNKNNLFVVGDDDQSIYKFRGATPEDFLNFEKIFPNSTVKYMTQNFRSAKSIVNCSNSFISLNNGYRYQKNMRSNKKDESYETGSGKDKAINFMSPFDMENQAKVIVDKIVEQNYLGDVVILYRNNASAIPFINELHNRNISFSCTGANDFFNNSVIKDIIAFWNLAKNPCDIEAFKQTRLVHYISNNILNYVISKSTGENNIFDLLLEAIREFPTSNLDETKCNHLKFQYSYLKDRRPAITAIHYIENEFKYLDYLDDKCGEGTLSASILRQNLMTLETIAKDCTTMDELILKIEKLQEVTNKKPDKKDKPAVYLKTIHSAKGLEWNNVFLVDMIDGIFPSVTSLEKVAENYDDQEELREERRLCYVGMTRAQQKLFFSYPKATSTDRMVEPSLFIQEIRDLLYYGRTDALDTKLTRMLAKRKRPKRKSKFSYTDESSFPTSSSTVLSQIQKNDATKNSVNVDIKKGDKIQHNRLGIGTVVNVKNSDEDKTMEVDFNGIIKKYNVATAFSASALKKLD